MARKFSNREKDHIRQKLIEQGKVMFGTFGLNKTSIGEITKRVGIAQGTFYTFYPSKEELYYEIVEQEEEILRRRLLNENSMSKKLTKEVFCQFLHQSLNSLEESPILRQLYDESVMEQLMRKLPPEKLAMNSQNDLQELLPLIEYWQAEGMMIRLPPEIIVSMIRSLVLLTLQKKSIGESVFDETIAQFIRSMADRLVIEEVDDHD